MSYDDNFLERLIADSFHVLYYYSNVWNGNQTKWLGVGIYNHPFDMWIKQEIVWETKPTLYIETGSAMGGSSLFYATLFEAMGKGRVISVDLWDKKSGMGVPEFKHKRIQWMKGSSVDPKIVKQIKTLIKPTDRVMVGLDSDHTAEHVLKELQTWGPVVTPGCYCVVDDTNLGGHPVMNANVPGPGPWAAVETYLKSDSSFEIDKTRHKLFMTWSPNGFLRKRET